MARNRSVKKGRVFKDFKDRREYQTALTPDDFPDPPYYSIMPKEIRQMMKQDITRLTRVQLDELFRISKQYRKEYNLRKSSR